MKNPLVILGLLCLFLLAYGLSVPQHVEAQDHTSTMNLSAMAVEQAPTVSPQFIDHVLCENTSPACGTGGQLYSDGVDNHIDPVFALAFFQHESTFGRYGVAAATRGLGNIRCSVGYACKYGFRAYKTWQDGYIDWYKLIAYYVQVWHKSTVDEIVPTYAPSSENDTANYIQSIKAAVSEWRGEVVR